MCNPAIVIAEEFTGSVLFDLAFLTFDHFSAECTLDFDLYHPRITPVTIATIATARIMKPSTISRTRI